MPPRGIRAFIIHYACGPARGEVLGSSDPHSSVAHSSVPHSSDPHSPAPHSSVFTGSTASCPSAAPGELHLLKMF